MADWKIALAQHPMYLIIKEDSQCAERTPPWGEPTIERYIDRLRDNIAALRRYPNLRLGYEWSTAELELLAQNGPDILAEMRALAQAGRVSFYNGTYAQPHLQTLSAEANYRQFEWGLRRQRELCGCEVRVYQHQETSVHDQVPQLLRAFGIDLATLPAFPTMLALLDEGELLLRGDHELGFVHGQDFVWWQGLDGSQVNLYLRPGRVQRKLPDWLAQQRVLDFLHAPPIIVHSPDMINVDDEWLGRYAGADFVLLDEALPGRLRQYPPQARARLYASWSYVEGIRAEELGRCNWQAEAAALQAEALNAMAYVLAAREAESSDSIWKTILTSQHHDVYCFSAPELRAKAIGWLQQAQVDAAGQAGRAAAAVIEHIDTSAASGQALVVFNSLPYVAKELVTVGVEHEAVSVQSPQGAPVPSEVITAEDGSPHVRFWAEAPGLGYATYRLSPGGSPAIENQVSEGFSFENSFYQATLQPNGTFSSLILKSTGAELLHAAAGGGNQLRATDSRSATPQIADLHAMHQPRQWQPASPLPELAWETTAAARQRVSPLGSTLLAQGRLGDQVEVTTSIAFYHDSPRIDLAFAFTFDQASIGLFFTDETKLRLQWPLAFSGDIYHDIPFGVVNARPERPLLPTSWIDVSDGRRGLAYFHQGTGKHWLKDGVLANLFAWGEDTDVIGNRIDALTWPKGFDQRLQGRHTIRCAIYPHTGDWRAADLVHAAQSYGRPPLACPAPVHRGDLPPSLSIMTFADRNLCSTAIRMDGEQVLCRVYAGDQAASLDVAAYDLSVVSASYIAGGKQDHLEPFQIGEVRLARRH